MYRKFQADHIFNGYNLLAGQEVLITSPGGEIKDIVCAAEAGDDIERFSGILSPGFINCHCHLELSHLKGIIPRKTGLADFAFKVVRQRHFSEQHIIEGIRAGEAEMHKNGIVATGDICNTGFTINQKSQRNSWYRNFIEIAGFPPGVAEERYRRGTDLHEIFSKDFPETSLVPHAPYSVSPELFKLINNFSERDIISIHNQESPDENELFMEGTGNLLSMLQKMNIDTNSFQPSGKSSLQSVLPYLSSERSLLLVHNVFTSEEDIQFAKTFSSSNKSEIFYCLCPNANLYISDTLPDIQKFIKHDCNIVLGTDSLASNEHLSIVEEVKTINLNFPSADIEMMLKWATSNGARALDCDTIFGSFDSGKQPGVVLIEFNGEQNFQNAVAKRIL